MGNKKETNIIRQDKDDKNVNSLNESLNQTDSDNKHVSASTALDDEQRIKVLSPTMLVVKRFLRNRLAIVGMAMIIVMFVFSFIGGWVSPYKETEVFTKTELAPKDYASVKRNDEYRYIYDEGRSLSSSVHSSFVSAASANKDSFTVQDKEYYIEKLGESFYQINSADIIANIDTIVRPPEFIPVEGKGFNDEIKAAYLAADAQSKSSFELNGRSYTISGTKQGKTLSVLAPSAIASLRMYDQYNTNDVLSYEFRLYSELAIDSGEPSFEADGRSYTIEYDEDEDGPITIFYNEGGSEKPYVSISYYIVQAYNPDTVIPIEFKEAIKDAISDDKAKFVFQFEDDEEETEFTLNRQNLLWTAVSNKPTYIIDSYAHPSLTHPVGTDGAGMDLLTRMMYGGRISLLIGFISVCIETVLGVILGGIAGFFGKWVDNLIMRIVDIMYCIPTLPLIIIIGSVMDALRVPSQPRIFYLMFILGFLGWPSIARTVRGQILSLREQEFMIATEATGISVSRRIFKHLVPNVIPQLIVISTMGLGSVILYEASLSFLGLGVKFPYASWGNIITAVSTSFVMTNYWFVWIPAGLCILITVLGFNFIGDGLRDAFDPKMKR
jgi:peptide/nickel transport system permease protein